MFLHGNRTPFECPSTNFLPLLAAKDGPLRGKLIVLDFVIGRVFQPFML